MPQFLIKFMTFLMMIWSLNTTAGITTPASYYVPQGSFTSSDYDVTAGETVTLNFYAMGPNQYPVRFNIYVTKPGSSSRNIARSKVSGSSTTVTLNEIGTHVFEIDVCYIEDGSCDGTPYPHHPIEIVASAPTTPKPVINISYPSAFYAEDLFTLEVTTSHATSCTFRYAANAASVSFGTYLKVNNVTYTAGTYVQTASCTGPGGSTSVEHPINVLSKLPPPGPVINSFLNGNVISGQTLLYWSSSNTERCTLRSGSTTANVGTSGIGYKASVPFGGRTFTLSCFQSNQSVSRELFVPRPSVFNEPCVKYCDIRLQSNIAMAKSGKDRIGLIEAINVQNDFVLEHNASLMHLNINLRSSEVTFNTSDLNDDGYLDLIVYQPTLQLAHVLLSDQGSFDAIAATAEWVNDRQSIKAIHVDEEGQVKLEVMPNMVISN